MAKGKTHYDPTVLANAGHVGAELAGLSRIMMDISCAPGDMSEDEFMEAITTIRDRLHVLAKNVGEVGRIAYPLNL